MAEDATHPAAEEQQPTAPEPTSTITTATADSAPSPPAKVMEAFSLSLTLWPPSQRTRDAVVRRLVQTLAAPSVLSQRYGSLPEPEAESAAAAVEAEAFAAVSSSATAPASVEDGIAALQAYSKEVSGRLLELAKSRAGRADQAAAAGGESKEGDAKAVETEMEVEESPTAVAAEAAEE